MQKAWLMSLASLECRKASEKLARTVSLAILEACCGSRSSRSWSRAGALECNRVQKRHWPWLKQAVVSASSIDSVG